MWREARSRADVRVRKGLHVSCQAVCFSILELRILISRIFRIFKIFGLEIETKTGRRNRDKNLSRKMRLVWARHNKASVRAQCWSRFPRPVLVSIPDPKNYKNRETWLPHFTIFLIFWIGNCVQTWRGNRDENWSQAVGFPRARPFPRYSRAWAHHAQRSCDETHFASERRCASWHASARCANCFRRVC